MVLLGWGGLGWPMTRGMVSLEMVCTLESWGKEVNVLQIAMDHINRACVLFLGM